MDPAMILDAEAQAIHRVVATRYRLGQIAFIGGAPRQLAAPAARTFAGMLALDSLFGLPAHIFLVHIPVVLIPLGALGAVLMLWPRLRAIVGWWVCALLIVAGISTQLAISSGQSLREYVQESTLVREHTRTLILAMLAAVTTFVVFYVMTVFTLNWGTAGLGFSRQDFLELQMIGVLSFALTIPLSAAAADRVGRWPILIGSSVAAILFGLTFAPLFGSGDKLTTLLFLSLGLGLMGWTYGPLGSALAELFPTAVRYTGASLTFNLAGILGGSLAPYIASDLAASHGIAYVGYYVSAAAVVTLAAQLAQ